MKTLIIGPSWVGDMMMSQSLYRTLKHLHPDIEIDVMAPRWCLPLLNRMDEVNTALEMPLGHGHLALTQRYHLGYHLRERKYQHAIILPNSFKSALIPFFAHIPKRTGWRGEMRYGLLNDLRVLDKKAWPRMVERYIALAYDKGTLSCAADLTQPVLSPALNVTDNEIDTVQQRFSSPKHAIGFCPGAEFGPAKRWPHYHYATLAKQLINQGHHIVLFGSKNDAMMGEAIREELDSTQRAYCLNLAGKTTLEEAVTLIAGCQAIISNDSGLMHIAAALNKPLIALYGPSSPDFTPPLSSHAHIIRLIDGYHKVRHGEGEQGYHQSLIDIHPDHVLSLLLTLLKTD